MKSILPAINLYYMPHRNKCPKGKKSYLSVIVDLGCRIHMHYACFSLCHKIFFRIAMLLTTYLLKVCTLFRHGPFDPSITLEFLVERSTHSHIEGSNFSFGFGRLWLGQNPPFRKSKEFRERTAFPYTSLYIRIENTLSYLPLNYLYC